VGTPRHAGKDNCRNGGMRVAFPFRRDRN
jgi:hypothetical protein